MRRSRSDGFTLVELVLALLLLLLLSGVAWRTGGAVVTRQRLEVALRRMALGLERARSQAQRQGSPCGLNLGTGGWQAPPPGGLPACGRGLLSWSEAGAGEARPLLVRHNLPSTLRFTANGLVLDGGTVVLAAAGLPQARCLVMALPLGVVRLGRYGRDPGGPLDASACLPEGVL